MMLSQEHLEWTVKNLRDSLISLRLGDVAFFPEKSYRPRDSEQIEKASWLSFVYFLEETLSLQRFELHGALQIRGKEEEQDVLLKELWDEIDPSGDLSHHGLAVRIEQFVVGQA